VRAGALSGNVLREPEQAPSAPSGLRELELLHVPRYDLHRVAELLGRAEQVVRLRKRRMSFINS
jgi:hypothetical protein